MLLRKTQGGRNGWVCALVAAGCAVGATFQLRGAPVSPSGDGGPSGAGAVQGTAQAPISAKVINIVKTDWRADRGTADRRAGRLRGPLPSSEDRVVAGCSPADWSIDIECDDGDPCTVDATSHQERVRAWELASTRPWTTAPPASAMTA